jgi:hypothetical protein
MNLNRSILPIAVVALFVGCSQQGEGERCMKNANRDADCASGLVCIEARYLESESTTAYPTDRCCPQDERATTDARCTRTTNANDGTTTPSNGTAGAAGASTNSQAGSGGSSSAGAGGSSAGTAGTVIEAAGAASAAGAGA